MKPIVQHRSARQHCVLAKFCKACCFLTFAGALLGEHFRRRTPSKQRWQPGTSCDRKQMKSFTTGCAQSGDFKPWQETHPQIHRPHPLSWNVLCMGDKTHVASPRTWLIGMALFMLAPLPSACKRGGSTGRRHSHFLRWWESCSRSVLDSFSASPCAPGPFRTGACGRAEESVGEPPGELRLRTSPGFGLASGCQGQRGPASRGSKKDKEPYLAAPQLAGPQAPRHSAPCAPAIKELRESSSRTTTTPAQTSSRGQIPSTCGRG